MFALQSAEETLRILNASHTGLSAGEVRERQLLHGKNALPAERRSLVLLFLRQFRSVFVYILLIALALSAVHPLLVEETPHARDFLEAGAIAVILLLNALLGFLQEYKAEQAIELLKKLSSPTCRVRRGGAEMIVPSEELVPGDIVIVDAGDKISADGRLLRATHLSVNESSLTGESLPVEKTVKTLAGEPPLPEQRNMVFCGTTVASGSGEFAVTAIGPAMELGKIAALVTSTTPPQTPLQAKLQRLSYQLGGAVCALALVVTGMHALDDTPLTALLLMGISLAVSAVPEGLPAVVTACFAIGVRRMSKRNVLVRRLEALETLGSVTVICTDKTGTVTENRMTVMGVWLPQGHGKEDERLLAEIAASCNHAELPDIGDPTEVGLLRFAHERGVKRLHIDDEPVPFTSEQKYMATRHGERLFFKGAPEKIAELTGTSPHAADMLRQTSAWAKQGLRVLAHAVQENGQNRIVGLIGMEDPPRQGVAEAVAKAKHAGIRTIMITGDNAETARSIAAAVGIGGEVLEGKDLMDMDPETLRERVRTAGIFARVSPEHKVAILEALQHNGEIVAMSGDGVNDAPALKRAHVGVAMGKNGTDVARDAASIVLTDDHFATIVAAIEEGRHIYDNIRKFILLLLRMNFYELLFFLITSLLGLPLPYLPIHILWINLMTDGLPALSLTMEEPERNIMSRPPRPPREHILAFQFGSIFAATLLPLATVLLLYTQLLASGTSLSLTRTAVFTFAVLFELLFVSTVRSSRPLHEIGFFSNRWLLGGIAVPLLLQVIIVQSPVGELFGLTPLTLQQWMVLTALASSGLLLFEAWKIVKAAWRGRLLGRQLAG